MTPATRALGAAILLSLAHNALAQSGGYPNRPIRMINPYAPGGAVDVVARPFAQKLTETLGQSVIIDNRPGRRG